MAQPVTPMFLDSVVDWNEGPRSADRRNSLFDVSLAPKWRPRSKSTGVVDVTGFSPGVNMMATSGTTGAIYRGSAAPCFVSPRMGFSTQSSFDSPLQVLTCRSPAVMGRSAVKSASKKVKRLSGKQRILLILALLSFATSLYLLRTLMAEDVEPTVPNASFSDSETANSVLSDPHPHNQVQEFMSVVTPVEHFHSLKNPTEIVEDKQLDIDKRETDQEKGNDLHLVNEERANHWNQYFSLHHNMHERSVPTVDTAPESPPAGSQNDRPDSLGTPAMQMKTPDVEPTNENHNLHQQTSQQSVPQHHLNNPQQSDLHQMFDPQQPSGFHQPYNHQHSLGHQSHDQQLLQGNNQHIHQFENQPSHQQNQFDQQNRQHFPSFHQKNNDPRMMQQNQNNQQVYYGQMGNQNQEINNDQITHQNNQQILVQMNNQNNPNMHDQRSKELQPQEPHLNGQPNHLGHAPWYQQPNEHHIHHGRLHNGNNFDQRQQHKNNIQQHRPHMDPAGQQDMGQIHQNHQPHMGQIHQPHMGQIHQNHQPHIGQVHQNQPHIGQVHQNQPDMDQINQNQPQMGQINQNQPQMGQINQNQPQIGQINQNIPQMDQINQNQPHMGHIHQDQHQMLQMHQHINNPHVNQQPPTHEHLLDNGNPQQPEELKLQGNINPTEQNPLNNLNSKLVSQDSVSGNSNQSPFDFTGNIPRDSNQLGMNHIQPNQDALHIQAVSPGQQPLQNPNFAYHNLHQTPQHNFLQPGQESQDGLIQVQNLTPNQEGNIIWPPNSNSRVPPGVNPQLYHFGDL